MARRLAVLMVLGAVSGCDDGYHTCYGDWGEAEALVDTSGDVPIFDWELGTAYAVTVYAADDELGSPLWHLQCGGDNLEHDDRLEEQVCIRTPLVYGERPDSEYLDTVNLTGPEPLEPGVRYRVQLNTMVEADGEEPESDGELFDWLDWESDRDDPGCGSGFSSEAEFVAPDPGASDVE